MIIICELAACFVLATFGILVFRAAEWAADLLAIVLLFLLKAAGIGLLALLAVFAVWVVREMSR